jgi:hypothetical protein
LQAALATRQKWRSKTHQEGGANPKWHETHVFQVVEGDDRLQILVSQPSRPMTIHCAALSAFTCAFVTLLQCYDEDNGSDDFIGSVTVHLNQVFAQGEFHLHGSCSLVYSTYAPFQASETSIFLSSPNPPSHQAKSG